MLRHFMSALVGLALVAPNAASAAWPDKPVKIICPYAPGGSTDTFSRFAAQLLSEALGQQFVVENKTGANGIIAADALTSSQADGYTLMMAATPQLAIAPNLQKVRFDPAKDFTPITIFASNPFVLVVHNSVPAKNLQELVAYAKANPNKLTYASAGPGSVGHLTSALLAKKAGFDAVHVPYKGNAVALTDLVAGHVHMLFANISEAMQHVSNPHVRILAVSSKARVPQLPDVPTVAETFPGFETMTWNGLVGPAGLPAEIVTKVQETIATRLKDPAVRARLVEMGNEPVGNTSAEFAKQIQTDLPLWKDAVEVAGAKPN